MPDKLDYAEAAMLFFFMLIVEAIVMIIVAVVIGFFINPFIGAICGAALFLCMFGLTTRDIIKRTL